ncbi:MAG: hypothetical protein ACRCTI_15365 [Beijerinckiaceae bacterium]
MSAAEDRQALFERLRVILASASGELAVTRDEPGHYALDDARSSKRQFFGSVAIKASYVSFHLFPVYCRPELMEGVSTGLKRRMQGKSCFNFKALDEELFKELDALTRRAAAG